MSGRKSPAPIPDANQGRLFLTPSSEKFIDFHHEDVSVSLDQRAFFLIESLNEYEKAQDIRQAVKSGWPTRQYGPIHAANLLKNAVRHENNSRKSFSDARGTQMLIEATEDKGEIHAILSDDKRDYTKFMAGYGSEELYNPARHPSDKERKKERTTIRSQLARFVQWSAYSSVDSTIDMVEVKDIAELVDDSVPLSKSEVTDETPNKTLTTAEKLQMILDDERAGFIPTTNLEKSTVLAYLSYLDNPKEFPLGPMNQLLEVARFHIKHVSGRVGLEVGMAAARNIVHMFGDFRDQAVSQLEQLKKVFEILHDTPNPRISLAVALNSEMQAGVPLLRYIDLKNVVAGNSGLSFNPMLSRNHAQIVDGKEVGLIEDPYTGSRSKKMNAYLKKRMIALKVADAREYISDAILDQELRIAFHQRILLELGDAPPLNSVMRSAGAVARSRVR